MTITSDAAPGIGHRPLETAVRGREMVVSKHEVAHSLIMLGVFGLLC